MIVNRLDLDIAVAEGIISRDQATRLHDLSIRDLAGGDQPIDFSQGTRDEPFRLLRGFRDIFIALGVVIFAVGLSTIAVRFIGRVSFSEYDWLQMGEASARAVLIALSLCAIGWMQAEFITRKQRLPLSSLVVSIAFAIWTALLFGVVAGQLTLALSPTLTDVSQSAHSIVAWAAVAGAIIGVGFFYWRYRLPFALLLLAASLVSLSLLFVRDMAGPGWFASYGRVLIGFWGLAIFAAAMWFDVRDRLRVTRLSECAFWLHLFAAPLLIQALLFGKSHGAPNLAFVLGTMAALSVIALLIDRRALLVSGLSYLAVAISQLVSRSTLLGDQEFAATAFILGGVMLTLGLGWTTIRRGVLAALPFETLKSWLPPSAP